MTNHVDRGRMEHVAGRARWFKAWPELQASWSEGSFSPVDTALSAAWVRVTESALIALRTSRSGIDWLHSPFVKAHASVLDPDGTKREANLLSRVKNHTHIVAFHDYGADGPVQYLVFEYLSGGTLAERIERAAGAGELIPPDEVVRYGRQLAGALAQIHAAGVIHRDVAPHNIWLSDRQKVKLGDFDSAVLQDGESGPRPITTEGYASPEERHGAPVDQRSDLYSLGGVLMSCSATQRPSASAVPTCRPRFTICSPAS